MIRKTMKMLFVALAAVCTLGSIAEAAPKKAVRHRAKHSTRVSSSTTESDAPKADKKATTRRRATSQSPAAARHKPTTTKPR
jgi:hypothetical protein